MKIFILKFLALYLHRVNEWHINNMIGTKDMTFDEA